MEQPVEYLRSVLLELASSAAQGAAYESWSDDFARKEVRGVWKDQNAPLRRTRAIRISLPELSAIAPDDLRALGFLPWDGKGLWLIPLWAVNYIDADATVTSISGDTSTLRDVDLDVRAGCIAYGFVAEGR